MGMKKFNQEAEIKKETVKTFSCAKKKKKKKSLMHGRGC